MGYTGNEVFEIIETLEFINFVSFDHELEFESSIPKCLHLRYGKINSDEIRKKIYFRVLNYLYAGEWDLNNVELEKHLGTEAKKAFGIAVLKDKSRKKTDVVEENLENSSFGIEPTIDETRISITNEVDQLIKKLSEKWKDVFDAHISYIEKVIIIDKIIVYEAPPYPDKEIFNYLLFDTASGPYADAIIKRYDENLTIEDNLVQNRILFFDLLMLP